MDNNKQNINAITDIKAAISTIKVVLTNLKHNTKKLSDNIETIQKESTEYKTKLSYISNDINDLKIRGENIKGIKESITNLKSAILELKELYTKLDSKHENDNDEINKKIIDINNNINSLKSHIDNFPLLYATKTQNKSLSEYIKLAPGVIAIISAIITIFVIYLKSVL